MKAIDLLPCPECGKIPELQCVGKECKYFCGVHVSCGDWKPNREEAAKEWNRRTTGEGQPEYYKLTNADRIRAMSDEELGNFLVAIASRDWGPRSLYGDYLTAYKFLKQPTQKEF